MSKSKIKAIGWTIMSKSNIKAIGWTIVSKSNKSYRMDYNE
jgi:hypothetical protein